MAEIVAALGLTHAPGLTGWFDAAPGKDQRIARDALAVLRAHLEASRPDVLIVFSNDHLLNWPINNMPAYTVGIGATHEGPADWFDEWLSLPKYRVPGHPELARFIVNQGADFKLNFAFLERMEFDDGFSVPLHYLTPKMDVRMIPIAMNCTVPPIPDTADAYRLGLSVREMVTARWPGRERVAVVATGGLSHEPGGPRYFWVDEAFDRWFLDLLSRGDHTEIVRECTLERMEQAGSGGTAELLAWIAALAFTRGPAEVAGYTPSMAWRTGTGMVVWQVAA